MLKLLNYVTLLLTELLEFGNVLVFGLQFCFQLSDLPLEVGLHLQLLAVLAVDVLLKSCVLKTAVM